jgi:glycosyltransferase involved in cell wall biosynthesis
VRVACVVPCYNEDKRLDIEAFVDFVDRCVVVDLIFVNDGSSDGTAGVLAKLRARRPRRISVVSLERNSGKAEAVRRGLLEGIGSGADIVGFWDADLSTPLDALPEMLATLEDRRNIDVVMGSRVQLLGRHVERNAMRHYAGRVFATLASMLLDMPVYDTQCGAKLFRVNSALRDSLDSPFIVGWTFDVELFLRLAETRTSRNLPALRDTTVEFPLTRWCDVAGSKVKASDFPRALAELARLRLHYRG